MYRFMVVLVLSCLIVTTAEAHNGRRDSNGGHNNRKAGNYHFHEGPLAGKTYESKDEALRALNKVRSQSSSSKTTSKPSTASFQGITIAPEKRHTEYDRDEYHYPASIENRIVRAQGGIYSPYSLRCFDSIRETDIEHIVAAAEAHESGLSLKSPDVRKRFAQDLDNLTLASPSVNRHQKSDKDPADWLPVNNRCWYVMKYIEVKKKYGLSMDEQEAEAIRNVIYTCKSFEMQIPSCN